MTAIRQRPSPNTIYLLPEAQIVTRALLHGCVANVLLVEEVRDNLWPLLATTKVSTRSRDDFVSSTRAAAAERVGLEVVVEQLDGVGLGAIGRKEVRQSRFS